MIKKILYLQIEEGKYKNNKIINDTVKWVPIVQDHSMTSTVRIGSKTIFSLEDAMLPIGYGLKGFKNLLSMNYFITIIILTLLME